LFPLEATLEVSAFAANFSGFFCLFFATGIEFRAKARNKLKQAKAK
jgi:hypothetical protein